MSTEVQAAREVEQVLGFEAREITLSGKTYQLAPIKAKQLSDVLKRVHALREQGTIRVELEGPAGEGEGLAERVKRTVKEFDFARAIMLGGDEVLYILHYASLVPRDTVFNLNPVELLRLAKETVELNVDFFTANLPLIQSLVGGLTAAREGIGEGLVGTAPSPGSSTADTE